MVVASQANALTKTGKEVEVTYSKCVRAIEKGKRIMTDEGKIWFYYKDKGYLIVSKDFFHCRAWQY